MKDHEAALYTIIEKARKYDLLLAINGTLDNLTCSFCGNSQEKVKKLIAGPRVYICDECVTLCVEIMVEDQITEEDIDNAIREARKND